MSSGDLQGYVDRLLSAVTAASCAHYEQRLVSLVVFGSMGRGTARADSDLDLLVVADDLPDGRLPRVQEFAAVEEALASLRVEGRGAEFATEVSPVIRTPAEILAGSPLLLDMVDDARILLDRDGFFAAAMTRLRARLQALGARRIWRGNAWFWDLKPDYQPGDVFEL